jgi:hypothetical protein
MCGLAQPVVVRGLRDFAQCEKLRDVSYRVEQLCDFDFMDAPNAMPRRAVMYLARN